MIFCPTCGANGNRLGGEYADDDEKSVFVYAGATAPAYMIHGSVTYRIITDNQGSVRLVVNSATGEVAQRLNYDAFGRVLCDTNPGFQPFGFQGGLYDPDTGLVEFGCRWYDAQTGRWISKDPIGLKGGMNLYEFCGSNPDGCLSWSQVRCFAEGFLIGAAVTVAVAIAAPALAATGAAALTTLGVAEATAATVATGTVTLGLFASGVAGSISTAKAVTTDIINHDYDDLAYTLGTIAGGGTVGALGGGRYISERLMGRPSAAPNTFDPVKLLKYEYANKYNPQLGPPGMKYWATAPTPLSGGVAAVASSSGAIGRVNRDFRILGPDK